MNRHELAEAFKNWLNKKTLDDIYCSSGFINDKFCEILSQEADSDTIFENDEIVVGAYDYEYQLVPENSFYGDSHRFAFRDFGIGCKENITSDDYELAGRGCKSWGKCPWITYEETSDKPKTTQTTKTTTSGKKTVDEVAKEVIDGK